jgi:hypothetical protein
VILRSVGAGSAEALFADSTQVVLASMLTDVKEGPRSLTVKGCYTDGTLQVPFTRELVLAAGKATLTVRESADFRVLEDRYLVAGYAFQLPLVLTTDEHLRMFGFAGAARAELFRMDMNDINRGGKQLISSPRGHWPYWDIGGVIQLSGSYQVWKANHADTMAYPIEQGHGLSAWADYSELEWGITCVVNRPRESAPWAIIIDARKGTYTIAAHPSSQIPVSARTLGRRDFSFDLLLHETSWPATYPCELPLPLYERFLRHIVQGSGGKPQPWVLYGPVGTDDVAAIVRRERLQPSVIMRTLYRDDAWRMQALMKTIGKVVPRHQPLSKWEENTREYLEYIKVKGLP